MLYAPMDHGKCVVCLESLKKDAAVNTSGCGFATCYFCPTVFSVQKYTSLCGQRH